MKTIYMEPAMEIVRFTAMDVIVTSGCGGENEPDEELGFNQQN